MGTPKTRRRAKHGAPPWGGTRNPRSPRIVDLPIPSPRVVVGLLTAIGCLLLISWPVAVFRARARLVTARTIMLAGGACQHQGPRCTGTATQVHRLHDRHFTAEADASLIAVCRTCHEDIHGVARAR